MSKKHFAKIKPNGEYAEDCFVSKLKELFDEYNVKNISSGFIGYENDGMFYIKDCTVIGDGRMNGFLYLSDASLE